MALSCLDLVEDSPFGIHASLEAARLTQLSTAEAARDLLSPAPESAMAVEVDSESRNLHSR
jgi:hypothetical protein